MDIRRRLREANREFKPGVGAVIAGPVTVPRAGTVAMCL